MLVPNVELVWTAASSLLVAANQTLLDNSLTPPNLQYVSYNAPPWDCDQLTVHFEALKPNRATTLAERRAPARIAAFNYEVDLQLTLVGCVPVRQDVIPTADEMSTNAHGFYQRAWTLYHGLTCQLDTIFNAGTCTVKKIGELSPHGPQGGYASFTINFNVELM